MDVNELLKKWIHTVMAGMGSELDSKKLQKIMEKCGAICAEHHASIDIVKDLKKKTSNIDELLVQLNAREDFWCGEWIREGDTIYSVCRECGCPLVMAGLVELSAELCECSRGWVKVVFEEALGKPVFVELTQAIGNGDPICKFIITAKKD